MEIKKEFLVKLQEIHGNEKMSPIASYEFQVK